MLPGTRVKCIFQAYFVKHCCPNFVRNCCQLPRMGQRKRYFIQLCGEKCQERAQNGPVTLPLRRLRARSLDGFVTMCQLREHLHRHLRRARPMRKRTHGVAESKLGSRFQHGQRVASERPENGHGTAPEHCQNAARTMSKRGQNEVRTG